MPILTLTTDFGTKSFDVAALKGKLMCASTNLSIIDISHNIAIYDKINGKDSKIEQNLLRLRFAKLDK